VTHDLATRVLGSGFRRLAILGFEVVTPSGENDEEDRHALEEGTGDTAEHIMRERIRTVREGLLRLMEDQQPVGVGN